MVDIIGTYSRKDVTMMSTYLTNRLLMLPGRNSIWKRPTIRTIQYDKAIWPTTLQQGRQHLRLEIFTETFTKMGA